jgi:CubicO group peptidase (beta-lactamase class C family)
MSTETRSKSDAQIVQELKAYVENTLAYLRPCSGGIVVSRDGEILLERYLRGVEPQQPERPVNRDALWPMWSVTKSFGATVLISLASDGLVALDDPAGKYLPAFTERGDGTFDRRDVTLRHLASHTSGAAIAGKTLREIQFTPQVDLHTVQIDTEPGRAFLYSGLGCHILLRALEAATGQGYERLLQQRVLDPLGLRHTRYIYDYDPALPMLPCHVGEFEDPLDHFYLSPRARNIGTGLYTTTRELNRFGQLWLTDGTFDGHRYFDPALKAEAWREHGIRASDGGRYGLLWWLFEEEGGYVASGAGHSLTAVAPSTNVVVTVTRNRAGPLPSGTRPYIEDKRTLVRFAVQLGR